ncbi:SDR family NAD(P)-dependent oxidoreductase [Agitococcus lubricus]|uniref:Short-subunit dehydrogenase n=1 Tax=Agitococcus lubricus TaxID=1077255 RepID=A0A2T5IVI1_9GAMM|nr:SDR family NAD(P)-dependent oxidoreductase [Agitococcus lubricus]PTQ87902.1 short-subunit dehydrogenase [Agitococcus lubricus]
MSLNRPISSWQQQRVWLVGASSGIGLALAQQLAQAGARIAVSARNTHALAQFQASYPNSLALGLDINDIEQCQQAYQQIITAWQGLDVVIFCAADYQAMRAWELSSARMKAMMMTNYGGALHIIETVLGDMLAHQQGTIAVIASVAGYMGLPKSLSYGPTKAALINLCETLYLDLHPKGINVTVINPGFVETPLTANNDFKMPALISPTEAAEAIIQGFAAGDFEIHFPKRFTNSLKLIRRLPYRLQLPLLARVEQKS